MEVSALDVVVDVVVEVEADAVEDWLVSDGDVGGSNGDGNGGNVSVVISVIGLSDRSKLSVLVRICFSRLHIKRAFLPLDVNSLLLSLNFASRSCK